MEQSSSRYDFRGKTAIVTGAGSGIGKATALQLAQRGARVIATDIVADRLEALVAEYYELDIVPTHGDVTQESTAKRLLAAADGHVDILANVAGIMDGFLPAAEVDDATWDRVFAINVVAVMRLTRAVLPGMIAGGGGCIVNVASEAALRGSAAGVAYTAAKHAVVGMTKSTAFMYSPDGIRANAVAPGSVETEIDKQAQSEHGWNRLKPVLRALVPPAATSSDIADSIVWLCSDGARNVNGIVLTSDGGWSAA